MRGLKQYKSNRVESASPRRLLVMLFETAVVRQQSAIYAMEQEDMTQARQDLNRARAIFMELKAGLDPEVDEALVIRLAALYSWCVQELVKAEREKDISIIEGVLKVSHELLAAWKEAVDDPACPDLKVK